MTLPVLVIGPRGRLGSAACTYLEAQSEFGLVGSIDRGAALEKELTRLRERHGPRLVGLDVTVAGAGADHGQAMLSAGVRPVIGTSGVTPAEVEALDCKARALELGGLVVPNFSLGLVALQRMLAVAAGFFDSAALVETHHAKKRDAPSGTALELERQLQEHWRADSGGTLGVHSVRLPGSPARHRLTFAREGEELTLEHRADSPAAYLPGLRLALNHAADALGVRCGLDAILGSARSEA